MSSMRVTGECGLKIQAVPVKQTPPSPLGERGMRPPYQVPVLAGNTVVYGGAYARV